MSRPVISFLLLLSVCGRVDAQEAARAEIELLESSPVTPMDSPVEQTLSLSDLETMAFQSNPTLASASARIRAARGKHFQAGRYPNPVIGYHATEIGNLGTSGQQGGFISQRFITAGKLRIDQAIAGKEIDEARFRLNIQQQRVLSDVRIRFYDALASQQRVALTGELAKLGDELVSATEDLIAGRHGTENDLLQAEISADQSRILLDNAVNEQAEAWRRLVAVVGVTTLQVVPLNGQLEAELPVFEWQTCYAAAFEGNPALSAARTRVERARAMIRRAQKEPIPDVDLSVSVRRNNITDSDVANVQVGVPVPIFNRNRGNTRKAEAEWLMACSDLKRIELDLQDRLAVAYRRYANARQQSERYQNRMLPRAEQSLKLVTDGYQKGQVQYLTLLNAQETFLRISLSYLNSLQELRTATNLIDGQLLQDSLSERN